MVKAARRILRRAAWPVFWELLAVFFVRVQILQIKLQLFAAVGAKDLAVLQNGLVKIDGLFTGGTGGGIALLMLRS